MKDVFLVNLLTHVAYPRLPVPLLWSLTLLSVVPTLLSKFQELLTKLGVALRSVKAHQQDRRNGHDVKNGASWQGLESGWTRTVALEVDLGHKQDHEG